MAPTSAMSAKTPTMKRILKEAAELANSTSPDYHASPLESNLFEWHFTLRGPPAPSPFANGLYHGRITLPATYPLRPPSFRFLTPSGRFEVNREICLSISGHHEETWQPAWGIRTALVAIRSFMDTDVKGQVGGVQGSETMRKELAAKSGEYQCPVCGKKNHEIMEEKIKELAERGETEEASANKEEAVPEELKLGYRDELGAKEPSGSEAQHQSASSEKIAGPATEATTNAPTPTPTPTWTTTADRPPSSPTIRAAHPPSSRPAVELVVEMRRPPRTLEDIFIDTAILFLGVIFAFLAFKRISYWLLST